MKKISLLILLFVVYGFSHKYYVSTSLYDFKDDSGSLQITIKVFQDDFTEIIYHKKRTERDKYSHNWLPGKNKYKDIQYLIKFTHSFYAK